MVPLVSVIIPVYNVCPYLKESLDSVINQTYTNLEIIIIDDGSNDGSEKICDWYKKKDERIRVIHQKNSGLSSARNQGLDIMTGQIVTFLDADDVFLPQMIQIMVSNMNQSQSDIVVCGFYICNTTRKLVLSNCDDRFNLRSAILSSTQSLNELMQNKIDFHVWNKIFKRHIFDGKRFKEGYVYEDVLLMPFLLENAKRIMTLDCNLVIYRKRPYSITLSSKEKNHLDWLYSIKEKEKYVFQRKPSEFTDLTKNSLIENDLECMIKHYLMLISSVRICSTKTKTAFKKAIVLRSKYITPSTIKQKVLLYSFRLNPYVCLAIVESYRIPAKIKKMLKHKAKRYD